MGSYSCDGYWGVRAGMGGAISKSKHNSPLIDVLFLNDILISTEKEKDVFQIESKETIDA